jgi:uncharacterized membrane protein YphA (DoxX/SURF4 family)
MEKHWAHGVAAIRIGLGVEFLVWGWEKYLGGWLTNGAALARELRGAAANPLPFYAEFLSGVVLPNVDLFAALVTLGELGAGISLTLGLLTRLGAGTGLLLVLNFMLMRGVAGTEPSIDRIFFVACLVCILLGAGRVWGWDARLRERALSSPNPILQLAGRMA